jgi:peptidyl-prolyl cis-trans isomerase C
MSSSTLTPTLTPDASPDASTSPATHAVPSPEATPGPALRIARVNGIALHAADESLSPEALRQRACTELLRQAAEAEGIDGGTKTASIEALLDRHVQSPEPSLDDCRRYFDGNPTRFARGERLRLRHLLFAVTPGVDVQALRSRAEAVLLDLRCEESTSGAFATAASRWSNCPTGQQGGDLGWVTKDECAPEFAQQVFGQHTLGLLPRLVHSRFGFHVVEVCERDPGQQPAFEDVQPAIALRLQHQAWAQALRRYVLALAADATLEGVDLDAGDGPLLA